MCFKCFFIGKNIRLVSISSLYIVFVLQQREKIYSVSCYSWCSIWLSIISLSLCHFKSCLGNIFLLILLAGCELFDLILQAGWQQPYNSRRNTNHWCCWKTCHSRYDYTEKCSLIMFQSAAYKLLTWYSNILLESLELVKYVLMLD